MAASPMSSLPARSAFRRRPACGGCARWRRPAFIRGYAALLDDRALGFDVTAFAMVGLHSQAEADLVAFEERVRGSPIVRDCYMLSGEIDFMLKCVAPDLTAFQEFIIHELTAAPNVASVKTSLVIRASKHDPGVPIEIVSATERPAAPANGRGLKPLFQVSPIKSQAVQDNPILVEVTRGGLVESCHRGAVAIADADGRVLLALGDIERPVYPRSAVKALQAIPLIESGAADAFGLGDAELAIACASHSGEAVHIDAVRTLLAKAGLDESMLACGAHWPIGDKAVARADPRRQDARRHPQQLLGQACRHARRRRSSRPRSAGL